MGVTAYSQETKKAPDSSLHVFCNPPRPVCDALWAYTEAKDKKVATTSQEGQGVEEKWGIKIQSVKATAEGFMLDFRYRIIDPEKSKMLLDRNAKPYLLNQATGEKMPVVRSRFGPIRHTTAKPTVDRNYSILFSNMNKSVKKGDKVTIVIGEFKAENLVVEAVEPPVPASGNPVHEASTTTKTDAVEEEFTNPKNPVEVTAGQNFTIILGANHTTGYRWEIAQWHRQKYCGTGRVGVRGI